MQSGRQIVRAHVLHIVPACNQNNWVDLGDPVLKEGGRRLGARASIHSSFEGYTRRSIVCQIFHLMLVSVPLPPVL